MSKRYQCAVVATIGSIVVLTTASFSWWAPAPNAPKSNINTGALVLDGTEIAKPFDIGIEGDQVQVNGQVILEVTPPAPATPEVYDLDTAYGVISNAMEQYAIIQSDRGVDAASASTLKLLRESELVDSARSVNSGTFEVFLKGDPYPEILELSGERSTPVGSASARQALRERHVAIENFLRQGRLVVLQDGILVATEPNTADERITAIRDASDPDLGLAQRRELLQSVIPDALVAELLANRLQADSGKVVQP